MAGSPIPEHAPSDHTVLPGDASSAASARRFVRSVFERWGVSEITDDAALLASELVTNAVLHARSDLELVARRVGSRVRVEVRDAGAGAPVMKRYAVDAGTGRGLQLVDSVADDWGVETGDTGKSVWFELDAPA